MTIHFVPSKIHLTAIKVNTEDAASMSLMALLLRAQVPVASSCKGDGICSKCRIRIVHGAENLTAEAALETKTKIRNKVDGDERLSCQVHITGDITVDTFYW